MEKSKRKNDGVPLQVFKKSENERGIYAVLLLLFIGLCVWAVVTIFRVYSDGWLALVCLVPFLGMMIHSIIINVWQEMVVYKDGIFYRTGAASIFTKWDNLCCFDWVAQGRTRIFVIKLYHPEPSRMNPVYEFFGYKPTWDYIPFSYVVDVRYYGNIVRQKADVKQLSYTEFGRLLQEHAPHLFENEN